MKLIPFCLVLASCVHIIDSYKILVYNSAYDHSHSQFLGNIADILVEAGNDVTSLIPVIEPRVKHGTEKSKKIVIERSEETEQIMKSFGAIRAGFFANVILDPVGVYHYRYLLASNLISQCRAVLNETQLLENLQNDQFDVMIVQNFDMCGVALSHLLQPRSLITSINAYPNSYMFEEFGIPLALSYNPSSFIPDHDVHSIWSRIRNIYANIMVHYHFYPRRVLVEELFREKFGADFPSLEEISSHAAYTLTNSEPLIDYATPTLNRIIPIGGIGAKPPKPLDQSWNAVLAQRSETILISFGSKVRSVDLPPAFKNSIATVIGRFANITFVWKYEDPEDTFAKETSPSHPNVHFSAWLPQNDLLNDDRVVAFVTHGGIGSSIECALNGKPGIFVPIFGDQPRNAGMMEHNGLGKVLDKFDLAYPDRVEAAIREVLTDTRYAEKSQKVRKMLANKPFSPRELLIKTVEFAAEFGPSKALRPQSYDMNAIEYHNLDILACATLIFILLVHVATQIVKWIVYRVFKALSNSAKTKTE